MFRPVICLCILLATGAVSAAELLVLPEGRTMGTTYHVTVTGEPLPNAVELQAALDQLLVELNRQMSTYDPESELSRFNRSSETTPFPVSAATARVVARALEIAERSQGAFDPTVGPLVRLWGFGSAGRRATLPTDAEIEELRSHVGYQRIAVQFDPPALIKTDPRCELDLSAIAKGYGVDVLAEHLRSQPGVAGYMVEIGGEVRTWGTKPDGTHWNLGIERPDPASREIGFTIRLFDEALATSGDYRNYQVLDGVRVSHTINPQTGRPITHNLASVTVLAADCMSADAWATALNVLGLEAALELAEQQQLAVFLIAREDAGFVTKTSTAAGDRFQNFAAPAVTAKPADAGPSFWFNLLAALAVFGIAVCGMAIGVIISNRRLRGSCGGTGAESACSMCSKPREDCDEFRRRITSEAAGAGADPTSSQS
jgi:thiamine biosynthesis lipoprotein